MYKVTVEKTDGAIFIYNYGSYQYEEGGLPECSFYFSDKCGYVGWEPETEFKSLKNWQNEINGYYIQNIIFNSLPIGGTIEFEFDFECV